MWTSLFTWWPKVFIDLGNISSPRKLHENWLEKILVPTIGSSVWHGNCEVFGECQWYVGEK
jgi:hypothetical protein